MSDYADAMSFLQKAPSSGGPNVFDALTSVVDKILEQKPEDAVDLLETVILTKKTNYNADDNVQSKPSATDTAAAAAVSSLYLTPEPPINEETGQPEEAAPLNDFQTEDIMADAALLEAVGAGLGKSEMYRIMLALKRLGEDPANKISTLRFFGKVMGTDGSYYVFESSLKEPVAADAAAAGGTPSEVGTGANAWTYFVCQQLGGEFTMLPDVTPAQIVTARSIKKYMTGNLDAEVSAYPPFPGTERNFLRAQIARIAASTVVCPKGYFKESEEGLPVESEDYAFGDMSEADAWSHRYAHLKAIGRCENLDVPEDEEEAAAAEAPETSPGLLTSLDNDAEMAEGVPAWAVLSSSSNIQVQYRVWGVRSNVWPGAAAVASKSVFANIYVGDAVKNAAFVPLPPPPVCGEYADMPVESDDLPEVPAAEEEAEAEAEA